MSNNESQARIEAIADQLRAKIGNKFQASIFLAGFGLQVLTIQISTFWQAPRFPDLLPFSICLMVVSICIYIAAVVKLDELTMPKRFWKLAPGEPDAKLAYLKDSDLWELKNRMVFYWSYLTAVAASLTGVSLLLMLWPRRPADLAVIRPMPHWERHTFWWTLLALCCLPIYFAFLRWRVLSLKRAKRWKEAFRFDD